MSTQSVVGIESSRHHGLVANEESRAIDLACGGRLEVVERASGSVVCLSSPSGPGAITIQFTERGPLVTLAAADVEIAAARTLRLTAEELVVKASTAVVGVEGDLLERVGGDAKLHVRRNYELKSSTFGLEAVRGGAIIKANDDVDVKGERVRLN